MLNIRFYYIYFVVSTLNAKIVRIPRTDEEGTHDVGCRVLDVTEKLPIMWIKDNKILKTNCNVDYLNRIHYWRMNDI